MRPTPRSMFSSLLLLAAACSGARGAAEAAVAAADSALAVIGPEAARVVPDQLKPLTDAVAAAKDSMAAKAWNGALALVTDIPTRANDLAQAIVKEKADITEEINTLNVAMPRNLAAVKTRIDRLSRGRLPRGLSAETFDSVKTIHAEGVDEWPRIMTAFQAGNLADAITRATALKLKVSRAMEAVGLQADARAWSNEASPN